VFFIGKTSIAAFLRMQKEKELYLERNSYCGKKKGRRIGDQG
jgi:hypothetical protein